MRVLVLKVENGAEYEGNVFDFWVCLQTHSGKVLKVFDDVPFDLRNQENSSIEVALLAGFIQNDKTGQVISGTVVSEVLGSKQDWNNQKDCFIEQKWYGLETDFGTLLLSESDVKSYGLAVGGKVTLRFGRIDLVAYKQ
ncbi:MAG: hypothetical protein AAGU27_23960 [Dehalobacterium sp.]